MKPSIDRRKSNRILWFFAIALPAIIIVLALIVLGLILYPYEPLTIERRPIKVQTITVEAGQDIIYEFEYCKTGNDGARVSRTIQGTTYIPTPIVETITQSGCRTSVIHLPVPVGATPGTYHIVGSIEFNPNPFKKWTTSYVSEDFQVTRAE